MRHCDFERRVACQAREMGDSPRNARSTSGFTLVEMMVALVFIGVVLVSAFATVNQGYHALETARDYTRVAQVLQSQMEDVRMFSWDELEQIHLTTSGDWVQVTLDEEFIELFGDRYRVWRAVDNRWEGGVELTDQKEIRVSAWWQDSQGNAHNKIITTWFTKGGLHDYFYRSF